VSTCFLLYAAVEGPDPCPTYFDRQNRPMGLRPGASERGLFHSATPCRHPLLPPPSSSRNWFRPCGHPRSPRAGPAVSVLRHDCIDRDGLSATPQMSRVQSVGREVRRHRAYLAPYPHRVGGGSFATRQPPTGPAT